MISFAANAAGAAVRAGVAAGAVVACVGSCSGAARPPGPGQAPTKTSADREASAPNRSGGRACFTGGPPDAVYARVVIHEVPSGQPLSVIDLEVRGPRRDGLRTCFGAVMRELEIRAISEDKLSARVAQSCSAKPLPATELGAPAVLVNLRVSDGATLLGIERLGSDERFACGLTAFAEVRVATRRVSAYRSLDSCERARDALARAMADGAQAARRSATAWLDQAIAGQRDRVEQLCRDEGAEADCPAERRLLESLEARRQGLSQQPDDSDSDVALTCRRSS